MADTPVGVVKALAAVMAELPAIGKGDKSPEGYSYRGIEAITKHLQPLLAKHGVVIVPNATITSVQPSPAMKDGWQDVYATVEWNIYGPDGSTIIARTSGIGRDRADKGANKAQTQAFKYLLLHLLSIADKADDADGLTYEDDRQEHHTAPTLTAERVRAREVFQTIRSLGADDKASFSAWVDSLPKPHPKVTENAMTDDPSWCAQVAEAVELIHSGFTVDDPNDPTTTGQLAMT